MCLTPKPSCFHRIELAAGACRKLAPADAAFGSGEAAWDELAAADAASGSDGAVCCDVGVGVADMKAVDAFAGYAAATQNA